MKNFIDLSLYLCGTGISSDEEKFLQKVENAIKGGVTAVQLREKNCSDREFFKLAEKMKKITAKNKIPLIINDRVDIAVAVDAEGVHVGQNDLPCSVARKILGDNKIVGVSCSDVEKAMEAEADGADYIGAGAIFATATKVDAKVMSFDTLKNIRRAIKIPIVAIGGINSKNLSQLAGIKIEGISVASAILNAEDSELAAREILKIWKEKDFS